MSGYVLCHSACIVCGQLFAYNPNYVPSTILFTGEREPICRTCVNAVNAKRQKDGLEPFRISLLAYEPLPEEELG